MVSTVGQLPRSYDATAAALKRSTSYVPAAVAAVALRRNNRLGRRGPQSFFRFGGQRPPDRDGRPRSVGAVLHPTGGGGDKEITAASFRGGCGGHPLRSVDVASGGFGRPALIRLLQALYNDEDMRLWADREDPPPDTGAQVGSENLSPQRSWRWNSTQVGNPKPGALAGRGLPEGGAGPAGWQKVLHFAPTLPDL